MRHYIIALISIIGTVQAVFDGELTRDVILEWGFNSDTQFMFLDNKGIKAIRNGTFQQFAKLLHLSLNSNKIEELYTETFKELINLNVLELQSNFIQYIAKDAFSNLQSLNTLYLQGNRINSADIYNLLLKL